MKDVYRIHMLKDATQGTHELIGQLLAIGQRVTCRHIVPRGDNGGGRRWYVRVLSSMHCGINFYHSRAGDG